jgi:hypothetical protein
MDGEIQTGLSRPVINTCCHCTIDYINNKRLEKMDFIKDLIQFLRERKKFWLIPVILILLVLGLIIVFGGASAIAPFIYTLF